MRISQQALNFVAARLVSGQYDVVVVGVVESMSRLSRGSAQATGNPSGTGMPNSISDLPNQGIGAEMIADKWALSRQKLNEFALPSHNRAAFATNAQQRRHDP